MDERTRSRLAALEQRSAELFAEQAQLASERAQLLCSVTLVAPRKKRTAKPADIPNVAPIDRERARSVLAGNAVRRRLA